MIPHERANRVLIVEDEESIAVPLSRALRRAGFETAFAATHAEAREEFESQNPDLVLLDLMLPDGDGRDVAREIRSRHETPIIMLTARGAEADRVVGLELGADDYIVKPFSSAEVIARIRAVLRRTKGDGHTQGGTFSVGTLEVDLDGRRVRLDGHEVDLTRKEFDLLAVLVRRPGSVVSREDIMSQVWDENWFGPTKTLDVHLSALRRKIDDDPAQPRFIHTVRGVGFRFVTEDELAEP
ncbi:MAG: response regulator transcription factor [Solirubrobacterales bacterium]